MIIAGKTKKDREKAKKVVNKVAKGSSYFDDGYQVGDVSKTILATGGNALSNIGKGFIGTTEGVADALTTTFGDLTQKSAKAQATIWELFGNDDYAESLRQAGSQVKKASYENAKTDVTSSIFDSTEALNATKYLLGDKSAINNKDVNWSEDLNKKSVAGELLQSAEQGIGNIGAFVGLGALTGGSTAGTFATSFVSSYGNTLTNDLRNGASEKDAKGHAISSGMAEAISEQFFQGIPGLNQAGWADNLVGNSVQKYFGSKAGKVALKIFDSAGEGFEEIISNMLEATFEGIRNGKSVGEIFSDASAQGFFNNEQTRDAFFSAIISSAIANGASNLISNQQKQSVLKAYAEENNISTKQAQELFDSLVEKKSNLENTKNFKEQVETQEGIEQGLINELRQAQNEGQQVDLNELLNQTPNSRQEMQFTLDQDEVKNIKSDKQKVLADDMARLNNVKENHELFKTVNAIQGANSTQQYHITTTEGLYEMGIVNKDANGNYTMPDGSPYVPRGLNYKDGDIYINADVGNQSGTQAMYHEMFEGFKKASPTEYNEFKQMVTDIIGEEAIQSEYDTYKSMYGEELTDDIRDEIINDKFGELAESEQFINKIADNRTVLQKFIDTVKDMIKYVKGTQQERELIKLQKKLENKFSELYKGTDFSQNKGETAYSLDNQGRELTKQQQEYFKDSKVRDSEGNLMVMYHGTESNVGLPENEKFSVFDRDRAGSHGTYYGAGFYFTPNMESAQDYAKSKGDVYQTYLDMKNPYIPTSDTINEDGTVDFAPNFYEDFENRFKDQLPQYWNDENTNKGRVVRNILEDNGYDGVINGDTYVVFNSNQIKNVDNTNPTGSEDIRYSLSPKGEIVDNNGNKANFKTSDNQNNNLMVMQGLSTDNLKNILSLGGIPVPSLGITDAKYSDVFNEFGGQNGVVLLFSKDTINPKNKSNEVYSRDIYSKTIPEIYEKVDKRLLNQKLDEFRKYESEYGSFNKHDYSKSSLNSIVNDMLYADAAKAKFLDDNNYQYEKVYRNYKSQYGFTEEVIDKFLREHPDLANFNPYSVDNTSEITELAPRIKEIALDMMAESEPRISRKQFEALFKDKWYLQDVIDFYHDIKGYQRLNGQKEFDSYATRDNINNVVEEHKEEYKNWLRDKFKDVYGDKYFENDRGTKKDYTLENLTSYMKKGNTKAQQKGMFDTYGIGQAKGDSAKRYMSIEQIKLASEKLVDAETYKARHDAFEKIDEDVRTDIGDTRLSNGGDVFEVYSDYYMALGQTARGIDAETALRNNYFNNLSDEQIQKFKEVADALNNLPAKYFEAKPQRTVTLDEIKGIVVPNNIDAELRQQLLNNGYNLAEFDPSIEGDKTRVINQFEDLKFSMTSNENIDSKEIAPIGTTQQETTQTIQNELAPIRQDLSNITEQMNNLSNQIETMQQSLENTSKGYVETYNEQRNENIPTRQLTEEDANTLQDALMNDEGYLRSLDEQANMNTENTKLIDRLTNNVTERLDLEKGQKETLRNIVKESIENGYSADEISQALQKEFSEMSYEMTNQEAVDAKRLIRDMPLNVSDGIKTEIADYGKWKSSNFGKINFSKSGSPVDVAYAQLSERMPYFFPSDIANPTDQLLRIAEVANMATKVTETIDVDPSEFDNIADYIKNTTLEDEYNAQLRSQEDLDKYIQFDMTEDIAPTTIRTQESIDDYIENRDIAPVREDIGTRRNNSPLRQRLETIRRRFGEMITNRNYVIDETAKATGNRQIKFAGDMLNSVSGEAQYNINNKQTDMNGNVIGKSVTEIFEPSKKAGLYEAFNDYLVQKSNIERHRVGKGSQVPEAVSQQLVKMYETENPQFKEWAKDVYKYFDNVLQEQVDAGLITQEQFNNYRGEEGIYRSYVPFYEGEIDTNRFFDSDGNVKPVSTLKRSTGNATDVNQLLAVEDSMAKQTYAYKRAIRQNELYKEIVNSLDKYSDAMDMDVRDNPTNLNDVLYTTPEGDKILSAYVDGEKMSARISDELYNELSGDNEARIRQLEDDFSLITKPLQKVSNVRRNILTSWNPTFLARNAIKDIQDAVINSKHTGDMLKNYFGLKEGQKSAVFELREGKTKEAQQFLALYGADNLYGDYTSKKGNKFTRANELIELAPRFAEFKASLQNGESVQEAIYNAREVTTNFGRGGYITKALNRNGFTFLNANVQGLNKLVRNLSGENGVKGVTSVVVKGAVFAVLPSILNELLYGVGDDKDEEYEALPNYIKDNYYLIKTEGNNFVRIPKGRINSAFGSLARRTVNAIEGDENAYEGALSNAWDQIGVGDLGGNNILSPMIQAFGSENGEAWYGGDIVPTRLQNKPAEEQTDAKIDAISNTIGELFGVSPYKVNYVLDQYTGGAGDILLPMITPETKSGAEKPHEYLLAPIKDAFVVNSTDDNKYAGEFYNLKDKLEIQSNSSKATDDDKIRYKYMSNISLQMNDLYKERREVQADTTLGNKEKYAKVQAIQNEINALAKEGISNYQNATTSDNYSNVNDSEYYKNADGEWTKVNDDESEFTAGLNQAEKDLYFKTKNKIGGITKEYTTKTKDLDKDDPKKKQYSTERKENITQAIVNSGLDNYTKAMVYSKYYSDKDNMTNVVNAGYNVDTYITALNDIEQLRDKYSKDNGYTTEQRKQKTIAYINSLDMEIPQKAMLIRNYYTSFRDYNNEIVNYVNNLNLSQDEKVQILKGTGMTVNGNNVSWK